MIHEIAPHSYDPEYRKRTPKEDDTALVYSGKAGILTVCKAGTFCLPAIKDISNLFNEELPEKEIPDITSEAYFLFMIDDTGYYQLELPECINKKVSFVKTTDENPAKTDLYKGKYIYMSIHRFRELNPVPMVFAGATGFHIRNWRETVRFCGCCGAVTKPSETERAFVCTKCGYTTYPQVAPAVIVAVTNKDKILLVRNLRRPQNVRLELVSGYVEVGESFEHAVHREVLEEVGLHIKNIRF